MIRILAALAFLIGVADPSRADDKPKANALTGKEIADGWIMLFDGETTFGWKIEGAAEVKDGALILGGAMPTTAAWTTKLSDYKVRIETGPCQGSLKFESDDGKSVTIHKLPSRPIEIRGMVQSRLGAAESTKYREPMEVNLHMAKRGPTKLKIEVPRNGRAVVKSIAVRPLGEKPLFNGKNLDGWKQFTGDAKRSATKFTVTPAGELNAKNGPGDLQTEMQFDDFILQFECKTNGKALNSGIFFRCIANQYQNGYEAQIQNAYLLDRSKPIDFGTGAIYRRVKARKVVSNDNEWFTMTVAARGAHIATWVNGYQTVDWTDDRKPNDNPRQGLRTAKGHLSIQGHDPTTDLLFRNIRIAELPAK